MQDPPPPDVISRAPLLPASSRLHPSGSLRTRRSHRMHYELDGPPPPCISSYHPEEQFDNEHRHLTPLGSRAETFPKSVHDRLDEYVHTTPRMRVSLGQDRYHVSANVRQTSGRFFWSGYCRPSFPYA